MNERQRFEEQLRLLKTAIEQSAESITITTAQIDPPGPQIVYVNPAFTKMTGYALEDVIGKTPRILQGPKTDRAVLDRLRKDCEEGRDFFGETVNYRKDGSEFRVEWIVGPVRDERGEVTHFVATQREAPERRRVEEELRRSEEEFRSLFDLSAIGMAQVSPSGQYLRVNRKLCQMLGYSEQEMLRLTLHEVTHPDDREFSAARLASSFTGRPEEYSIEKRYVRKDGSIIWVLINWEVIRDARGQPIHTVANIQDITTRKRAVEALRANEAQLRAILDNSTAVIFVKDIEGRYLRINRGYEVVRGLTEAEVKGKTDYDLYSKGTADAVRANDQEVIAANTPLQFEEQVALADGLRHFIVVKFPLRDDNGRPYAVCGIATDITERKQAEEALKASEEQSRSLIEQASDGIFLANLEGVYTEVNTSACQMLGYTREELIGKKINDLIPPEDFPRLDELRERLLKGEAHSRSRPDHRRPSAVTTISPDFMPYIFDRFRQADASSVRRYGGLGLGLALVKYLVELHGETIEATSAGEGQGATFKVLLPVHAISSPLRETEGAPVTISGLEEIASLAGVRALVVDDETDARELVRLALARP